jgi:CheY-like chemotaxis protein
MGVVEDITERKQAEEALRQTQEELAHVSRVTTMGTLTASIAHEVNQPLTGVVTNGNACLRLRAEVCASAEDFLQSGHLPDTECLIVDVRMPRMSGLDLQRQLAKAHYPIPLIFITAHEDGETRTQALSAGAVAFLYKPFSDEVLLGAIHAALQSSWGGG